MCTPAFWPARRVWTMAVEKPLSVYVAEGRTLVRAAREYKRVVQTGTQQRTMEMDRFACELVRDGGIGKVRVVECVNFAGRSPYPPAGLPEEPIPPGVNWDAWQGPAPVHLQQAAVCPANGEAGTLLVGRSGGTIPTASRARCTRMASTWCSMPWALTRPVRSIPAARRRPGRPRRLPIRQRRGGPHESGAGRRQARFRRRKVQDQSTATSSPRIHRTLSRVAPTPSWPRSGPGCWAAIRSPEGARAELVRLHQEPQEPNADVEVGHRTATICNLIAIARELGQVGEPLRWDPAAERLTNSEEETSSSTGRGGGLAVAGTGRRGYLIRLRRLEWDALPGRATAASVILGRLPALRASPRGYRLDGGASAGASPRGYRSRGGASARGKYAAIGRAAVRKRGASPRGYRSRAAVQAGASPRGYRSRGGVQAGQAHAAIGRAAVQAPGRAHAAIDRARGASARASPRLSVALRRCRRRRGRQQAATSATRPKIRPPRGPAG